MDERILAVDLGTSGMKVLIFDPSGTITHRAAREYGTDYGPPNRAEQHPEEWWSALIGCLDELKRAGAIVDKISAVGITGHMMGAVPVDGNGAVIGKAIIHADTRASVQCAEATVRVPPERIYTLSGHRLSPAYSGPKIAWIRENGPERYCAAEKFLNPKDYLNYKLTGRFSTDRSDASGTLLYDLEKGDWSDELLSAFDIDRVKMPPIYPSGTIVGKVSAEASAATGLPESALVCAGAGDGISAGVGAGSIDVGIAYNYFGTTSWIGTTTQAPVEDPEMRVFTFAHAIEGLFHPMGTMNTAGGAIEWFCRTYLGHIEEWPRRFEELNRLASEADAGAGGLAFLPYLMGERTPWWNKECRAAWVGLGLEHGLREHARALFEGVANNLSMIAEILDGFSFFPELALLGGGGRSDLLPGVLSSAIGKPVNLLVDTESVGARGAAVIAGVAAGIFQDYSVAREFLGKSERIEPDRRYREILNAARGKMISAYKGLNK